MGSVRGRLYRGRQNSERVTAPPAAGLDAERRGTEDGNGGPPAQSITEGGQPGGDSPDDKPARGGLARILPIVLVVFGGLLLLEGALTVFWKEPFSAIFTARAQHALSDELNRITADQTASTQSVATDFEQARALTRQALANKALGLNRRTSEGGALGRLQIDSLNLDRVVVQGTGDAPLQKGPGHYRETPLPGARGDWTTGIAGHRTTYDAPFRHIDQLEQGDEALLAMPYGRFTYKVEEQRIVDAADTTILQPAKHDRLALSACHPLYSDAQRIIVYAKLVKTEPLVGPEAPVEVALGKAKGIKKGSPPINDERHALAQFRREAEHIRTASRAATRHGPTSEEVAQKIRKTLTSTSRLAGRMQLKGGPEERGVAKRDDQLSPDADGSASTNSFVEYARVEARLKRQRQAQREEPERELETLLADTRQSARSRSRGAGAPPETQAAAQRGGDAPNPPVFLFLIGFPAAMVSVACSLVGIGRANGHERTGGLGVTLACALAVLAGLVLALLGMIP